MDFAYLMDHFQPTVHADYLQLLICILIPVMGQLQFFVPMEPLALFQVIQIFHLRVTRLHGRAVELMEGFHLVFAKHQGLLLHLTYQHQIQE